MKNFFSFFVNHPLVVDIQHLLISHTAVAAIMFSAGVSYKKVKELLRHSKFSKFVGASRWGRHPMLVYGALTPVEPYTKVHKGNGNGSAFDRGQEPFIGVSTVEAIGFIVSEFWKQNKLLKVCTDVEARDSNSSIISIGGPACNSFTRFVMEKYCDHFFKFDTTSGNFKLLTMKPGKSEEVQDIDHDHGIIIRMKHWEKPNIVIFVIAGLNPSGTRAASYYFSTHWEYLLKRFGNEEYGLLLRFSKDRIDDGEIIWPKPQPSAKVSVFNWRKKAAIFF